MAAVDSFNTKSFFFFFQIDGAEGEGARERDHALRQTCCQRAKRPLEALDDHKSALSHLLHASMIVNNVVLGQELEMDQ